MAAAMQEKKVNIIHYLVVLAFCFLFRFIPPFAALTPYGMAILGAFLGAIYGWTFIDMIFPSFMALVGTGLTIGMNEMIGSAFGTTVISMIFIYLIIGVCMEVGAIDWLVNKFLSAKFMVGKPWLMIWFVYFAGLWLGGMNSVVMIVVFLSFLNSIFKQVGMPLQTKETVLIALGTVYAISLGQIMIPFMGLGLTLTAVYSAMFQSALPFAPWIGTMLPMNLVMITAYVLLMKFVFRCDLSALKNMTDDMLKGSSKITKDQKLSLIFFALFFICMICSSITQFGVVYKVFSTLGMFGITAAVLCAMMMVKREDGTPLLNFRKAATMIGWEPVLLTAFIMVVGTYMNSADAGISTSLRMLIAPLSGLSPFAFIFIALGVGAILTNFATNLIIIIIIMPVVVQYAMQVGMPTLGVLCLLFMSCHICLATPAASPQTGITFANEMFDKKKGMTYGAIMVVILYIIQMVVGMAWINLIF